MPAFQTAIRNLPLTREEIMRCTEALFNIRRAARTDALLFFMEGRYSPAGPAINSPTRANAKNLTIVFLAGPRACMSGLGGTGAVGDGLPPKPK
jgi:hypothetical protein